MTRPFAETNEAEQFGRRTGAMRARSSHAWSGEKLYVRRQYSRGGASNVHIVPNSDRYPTGCRTVGAPAAGACGETGADGAGTVETGAAGAQDAARRAAAAVSTKR